MLQIWFMFDNHSFAKINANLRGKDLVKAAEKLFQKDRSGMLFVRDHLGGDMKTLDLLGHIGYRITTAELEKWAADVEKEETFLRMIA